jgi:hypothetical protein
MRSQLPLCQPTPEGAVAASPQFVACPNSPRVLPLADTNTALSAVDIIATHGAPDGPVSIFTSALHTKTPVAFDRAFVPAPGLFEQNRATQADPAGMRRASMSMRVAIM